MVRQDTLLLTTLWALLLCPALCEGGVLAHPCDCDEHETCHHEADCATDPCVDVVRPEDDIGPHLTPAPEQPVTIPVILLPGEAPSRFEDFWTHTPLDPPPPGRPYPDSDLPLLI